MNGKPLRKMRRPRKGWNASVADFRCLEDALIGFDSPLLPGAPTEEAVSYFAEMAFDYGIEASEAIKRIARQFEKYIRFEGVTIIVRRRYLELNTDRISGTQSAANENDADAEEPSCYPASKFEGEEIEEQGWIVRDFVTDDDVIQLMGDGGAGKTTIALQLAVAKATGKQWLGMDTGEAAPVTFFSGEERTKKLKLRLNFIINGASSPYEGEDQVTWADLENLQILGLADRDALLAVTDKRTGRIVPTALYGWVDKMMMRHQPKLAIFDALYDIYGGDENARAPVRQFVSVMRRLSRRHGCSIIVTGHPSLTGMSTGTGTSGSTGWRNAFRSFIYLSVVKNNRSPVTVHRLESKKQNYGKPDAVIDTHWENGIFVVLNEDDQAQSAVMEAAKETFLRMLKLYLKEGRSVNATPGPNYAPTVFAADPRAGEFCRKKDLLKDAMNLLFGENKIVSKSYTKDDRKTGIRIELMESAGTDDEFEEAEPDFG